MTDSARGDGLPAPAPEALAAGFAALAAFAAGPYDDRGVTDAASLAADTAAYLDTASRRGGLTAVTTVGVITACLARACSLLQPALARSGDWLGEQISAGRVTGGRPPAELAGLAREAGTLTAGCAASLASALGDAHELIRDMIGPEPGFAAALPYDDLDTVRAATLIVETAEYLDAAVAGGGVTGPATLTGLTAGLAAAAFRMPQLLCWAGDWLGHEIAAGRVISGRPLPELAAAAQDALETSAALAAQFARALQAARTLSDVLRCPGEAPAPAAGAAAPPARVPRPLRAGGQLAEDLTIALGPALPAAAILRAFQDAHVIHGPWDLWALLGWAAVPLAVFLSRRAAASRRPPPAAAARRVLTWAATAVTVALTAGCAAADCALIARHALDGWYLLQPVVAIVPLQAAGRAIPRNRSRPPAGGRARAGPPRRGAAVAFYWERHPGGPFATLIRVATNYLHPENYDLESLQRLARREGDPEMQVFKAELGQALRDPGLLPGDELSESVQYDDGSDEAFLRRLWRDLYGD